MKVPTLDFINSIITKYQNNEIDISNFDSIFNVISYYIRISFPQYLNGICPHYWGLKQNCQFSCDVCWEMALGIDFKKDKIALNENRLRLAMQYIKENNKS